MAGPLAGVKVVEIAGMGPAPFAGMMLADHGADVIRVERPGQTVEPQDIVLLRSRRIVQADLKTPEGVATVEALVADADALIEGFRPGVMERLGLGPERLLGINPRLVYGRMTGWGQDGPNALRAGHDINYIATAGVLDALGRDGEKPTPPINLIGDFGGGGMMLAFGVLAALTHARTTGQGQVVDCAMTEGSSLLMAMTWGLRAGGLWPNSRGRNLLDTGAPFYDAYETSDGGFMAVGSIEPQFFSNLLAGLALTGHEAFARQMDARSWPAMREALATAFLTRTREEWTARFAELDACVSPVLAMDEAAADPQNAARAAFIDIDGVTHPAPAPRYSVTTCDAPIAAAAATGRY